MANLNPLPILFLPETLGLGQGTLHLFSKAINVKGKLTLSKELSKLSLALYALPSPLKHLPGSLPRNYHYSIPIQNHIVTKANLYHAKNYRHTYTQHILSLGTPRT